MGRPTKIATEISNEAISTGLVSIGYAQQIVPIRFAELHNPLFLAGTNHKQKLHANTSTKLELRFNLNSKQLYVLFNKEIAIIPESNISSMTPAMPEMFIEAFTQTPMALTPPKSTHANHAMRLDMTGAQVSDPSTTVQNPR